MIQKRIKALAWGGAGGILLGTASYAVQECFPNSVLEDIGFLFVSPFMYLSIFLGVWQSVVLSIVYPGVFCAAFTSLLLSIKNPLNRAATGLAILGTISVLHIIYARLFYAELFEVIGSDFFVEALVKIMKEHDGVK